jgi:hypothetical protein
VPVGCPKSARSGHSGDYHLDGVWLSNRAVEGLTVTGMPGGAATPLDPGVESDTDATREPIRCRVAPSSIGTGIVDQSGASTVFFIASRGGRRDADLCPRPSFVVSL